MNTDNTYMLFENSCGVESLPGSITNTTTPFYHSISKKMVQKHYYGQLETLRRICEDVNKNFEIIYNSIGGTESDPFYKFILVCIKTSIIMVKEIILKYMIIISKGIWASAMLIVVIPLVTFLKGMTEVVQLLYKKDKSIGEKLSELSNFFQSNVLTGLPYIISYCWQIFQSISFGISLRNLIKDAPSVLQEEEKKVFQKDILEKKLKKEEKLKLNFGTNIKNLILETQRASFLLKKATTGFNLLNIPQAMFWGGISGISKMTVNTLKYFFDRVKEKTIGDSSSFIWSKFESIVNSISDYIYDDERIFNKKYDEHLKIIQNTAANTKSRFEIANIIFSYPIYIFNISYSLVYWGITFNITILNSLLPILQNFWTTPFFYDLSPIYFSFLAIVVLRLLGTCWNIIQYKACLVSVCDKLGDSDFIQLEQKTCIEQCWKQGVSGITSLIIPPTLIEIISTNHGKEFGNLLMLHESLVKSTTTELFLGTSGIFGDAINFFTKNSRNLNTKLDWEL